MSKTDSDSCNAPVNSVSTIPLYPPHLERTRPAPPRPDLDEVSVDSLLHAMLDANPHCGPLPATRYGRRVAVDSYLALYEKFSP